MIGLWLSHQPPRLGDCLKIAYHRLRRLSENWVGVKQETESFALTGVLIRTSRTLSSTLRFHKVSSAAWSLRFCLTTAVGNDRIIPRIRSCKRLGCCNHANLLRHSYSLIVLAWFGTAAGSADRSRNC